MKRLTALALLLLGAYLPAENIQLRTISLIDNLFPFDWTTLGASLGDSFVTDNSKNIIVVKWKNGQIEMGKDETHGITGIWQNKALVLMEDESGDYNALYDPIGKTLEKIIFPNRNGPINRLYEYQNGLGLAVYYPGIVTDYVQPGAGLFNSSTGVIDKLVKLDKTHQDTEVDEVNTFSELKAFSTDKVHALYVFGSRYQDSRKFAIVDLTTRTIATTFSENFTYGESTRAQFLTNSLFIQDSPDGDTAWLLRDLCGRIVSTLEFPVLPDGGTALWVRFSPDLSRAIVLSDKQTVTKYSDVYFVDSSALVAYLNSLGSLFNSTTGTLNDSKVRMRENPNLEAKILNTYSKGETLELIDRSGSQVKIGSSTAYWYKVRTKDGIEGWVYGAYIDLANEVKQ